MSGLERGGCGVLGEGFGLGKRRVQDSYSKLS